MSYKQSTNASGKTDEQLYEEFIEYMFKDGVIEAALEPTYDGEYRGVLQEKIAADLSPVGMVFDPDHKELSVARHRAMVIRASIDPEIRQVCKDLDEKIKYDLSEEEKALIAEQGIEDEDIEDDIFIRPFCLYSVDLKNLYEKDLSALPENPMEFAKLALEHEMDCNYEDSEDEDDEDWEDEEGGEEDEEVDEDDAAELIKELAESAKGKGKAAVEEAEAEEEEEEHEHVHGEHCNHDHDHDHDIVDLDAELPFDEDEVTVHDADHGLKLLKEHRDKIVSQLEKISGSKIDSFKTYHFPGRHYVVGWLENFGIFGVRISYPMLINDESDDEEDEEAEAEASGSK
ncbi:hypothetical protein GQ54DRAFT_47533 [Martensiomyces pterosporus]|nr:hypothetical protein GQ54DRAFT_47533 [Martensiomyces pterosporus]